MDRQTDKWTDVVVVAVAVVVVVVVEFFGNMVDFEEIIYIGQKTLTGLP